MAIENKVLNTKAANNRAPETAMAALNVRGMDVQFKHIISAFERGLISREEARDTLKLLYVGWKWSDGPGTFEDVSEGVAVGE